MVTFVTHSIPEASLLADRVVMMTPPGPRLIDLEFDERFKAYSVEVRSLIFPKRWSTRDAAHA